MRLPASIDPKAAANLLQASLRKASPAADEVSRVGFSYEALKQLLSAIYSTSKDLQVWHVP
jgi:hypothetical protein